MNPIETYERESARLLGIDHAVAFGFARHALAAILTAAGLRPDDEVILSPLTCKAVPLALLSLQLRPVYADIHKSTLNLDAQRVQGAIGPRTRAILFQHTYGHMGGINAVANLAARHGVLLIEDCAQCLPLAEDDRLPGHHGQAAVFSNNLGKPLPAGSGGIAAVHDAKLAAAVQTLRDGMPQPGRIAELFLRMEVWMHEHVLRPSRYWQLFDLNRRVRRNYRDRPLHAEIADEITKTAFRPSPYQLRLGIARARKIASLAHHRRQCCVAYSHGLTDVDSVTLPCPDPSGPLYFYPVLVAEKAEVLQRARKERLEIIPWPISTPLYPIEDKDALHTYGYESGSCPVADSVATTLIGLPTHENITMQFRNRVVDFLKKPGRMLP